MKKPLLLGLVISLALGATACSSQGKEEGKDKSSANNEQNIDNKKNEGKKESTNQEEKFIYGKVKSIVGNEIEFELAKDPNAQIEGKEKEEDKKDEIKEEIQAVEMTPAIQGAKPEDAKVSVGKIDKNEPLVELEFTGDIKTITIPTGAKINILSGRNGEGLSAIKEGTYLQISVDDEKVANPNILSVNVIS